MAGETLSRRRALLCAACAIGFPRSGARAEPARRCDDVTAAPVVELTPVEEERHAIFTLLAMAMTFDAWGVDTSRPEFVAAYASADPGRRFASYLGHNIGAVLVDRHWNIINFALNRSVQLNSTLEHAEARSVRAAIAAANVGRKPGDPPSWSYGNLLKSARLYTTLAPCEQCAGILDIAGVETIVYAQNDAGQHEIVNVLYNLARSSGSSPAPTPIQATFSPFWKELDEAYTRFVNTAPKGASTGMTLFLQSIDSYRVYREATTWFANMEARYVDNSSALNRARSFRTTWSDRLEPGVAPN
jgi:tRNA(Arg) A34 adenosine deaminase TadA